MKLESIHSLVHMFISLNSLKSPHAYAQHRMRKLAQVVLINVAICGISSEHWQLQVTLKNVIVIMAVILT